MKAHIQQAQCSGHARCAALAPEVYVLDDDGYISFDGDIDLPDGKQADARRGAAGCPERVITILEV
jgi:ferredoxin